MNAHTFLTRYRKQYNALVKTASTIESLLASAQSFTSDGMPSAPGISDKTGHIAIEIAEAKQLYNEQADALWRIRYEIIEMINQFPPTDSGTLQASLLVRRYVGMQKWEEIADALYITDTYARGKLHQSALDNLQTILNKVGQFANNS